MCHPRGNRERGKRRTYPWYVEIGNGTGVKVKTEKGGFYIKGDSYKEEGKVFININDMDFFKLFFRVSRYIAGMGTDDCTAYHYVGKTGDCRCTGNS